LTNARAGSVLKWQPNPLTTVMNALLPLPRQFLPLGPVFRRTMPPPFGAGAEFQAAGAALRRPESAPIGSSGAPGGRSGAPIPSSGAPGARGGAPARLRESRPSAKSIQFPISTPRFLCR